MNSQFFKYSHRANPLILLFLGILGVIWGSTFFMGILICIGLLFGVYDTSLKNNDSKILGIQAKLAGNEFLADLYQIFIVSFIVLFVFWYFGFWIVTLYLTYRFMRHAYYLQKELKVTTNVPSKNS